jgi:hypothetical protein
VARELGFHVNADLCVFNSLEGLIKEEIPLSKGDVGRGDGLASLDCSIIKLFAQAVEFETVFEHSLWIHVYLFATPNVCEGDVS